VEVGMHYAKNSIFSKKEDRLNDAIRFASNFYLRYPASAFTSIVKEYEQETREEFADHIKLKKEIADRLTAQDSTSTSSSTDEN
jgi:outer membrane protein assembly factor BamD